LDPLRDRHRALSETARGNSFEFVIERLIAALCPRGATAVDVGANYGGHTFNLLQAVGPSGRVIAVEADPDIAATLGEWTKKNPNLSVVNVALADRVGEVTFWTAEPGYGSIAKGSLVGRPEGRAITVPATTLDALLEAEKGTVAFLKVDVEGAELQVLAGAQRFLRRHRPLVAIEINWTTNFRSDEDTRRVLLQPLADLGYEAWSMFGARLHGASPEDYNVVLVPTDRWDPLEVTRVTRAAFSDFMDSAQDWTLYRKFEEKQG
jgi:FkbM family methyltransferase